MIALEAPPGEPHGLPRILRAARIIHPFPTLLNVAATAGLGVVATDGDPDRATLARMMAFMFCAQSAIGVANDLCDRELDAATKPQKPLVAGAISAQQAMAVLILLLGAAVALAATFGVSGFALGMLGLTCGLSYDVRLKRTALSALPFMIAIPTLPLWVWVTLDEWRDVLWWLVPLGALIGLSLHLANTLPDLDDDASHGVRGLAHRLGRERSMVLAWASFATALALAVALIPLVDYDMWLLIPALIVGSATLAASVAAWRARRDRLALQFGFGVLGIGAAAAAVGWLAAVT